MVLSSGRSEGEITAEGFVTVTLKAVGPSRPRHLHLPSSIQVCKLRDLIASEVQLPVERLKLILRGKVLSVENGKDSGVTLQEGDSLLVAVAPSRPPKHLREPFDDEDELKFQIPESSNWLTRKFFLLLKEKMMVPDILLVAIFSISPKMWAIIVMWFTLAPIACKWDLGPLYILGTGFCIILFNLGQRQHGDLSAYSIFNDDFRELPGTLNAERLDRDIRAGQF